MLAHFAGAVAFTFAMRRKPLRPNITPALLLQFHQLDDARGDDGGFRHDEDGMAFGPFHAQLGIVAGIELELARKRHFLEMLDTILHRRGIAPQHVQARTVGDDIDVDVFFDMSLPGAYRIEAVAICPVDQGR